MKTKYITDKEVDDITAAIYNNTLETLYKGVSEDLEADLNPKAVKELFEDKGIEYLRIPELEEYIITRQGRVFNCKNVRYLKPVLTGSSMFVNIKGKRIPLQDAFEDNGWTYDEDEIVKNYRKNKWEVIAVGFGKDRLKRI